MRAFFLAFFTLMFLPMAALSQTADRPNTILVLDGSGSMWGQIDGVNKIVIAREVIAELLADLADDVSLGLTVYGHRQRGNCADIETIVEPAPFTQDRILQAVNSINPRGRTPMTDAVVAAAQSLRSTEEPATVILVSDGIENCNPDPCAIAAELEATGVNFTAHVIGFDVASEPEARAQMQCIADNTGGQFLTADNAAELSAALNQIVEVVMPVQTRIEAVVVPQMTPPTRPVTWTVLGTAGEVIAAGIPGPAILADLLPGDYVAQATRTEPAGEVTYQSAFTVTDLPGDPVQVAMPAIVETSQITFSARVEPDMSMPTSALAWTLYDMGDTVLLGPVIAPGGNVALLPGDYRLEVERASTGTRHEARFTVEANTPQDIIIPLPAVLVDITVVARIGDVGGLPVSDPVIWEIGAIETDTVTTNPATFQMARGAYRVTAYWTAQEVEAFTDFVVVDQAREIVVVFPEPQATATVTAPDTAVAGSTIEVAWTGPDDDLDYIGVGMLDRDGNPTWETFTYTRDGSTLRLQVPPQPGQYYVTYFQQAGRTPLASVPLTVTPAQATITAPATAAAGSTIEVAWTGPDYDNDYLGIGRPDRDGRPTWENFTYTREGATLRLVVPTEPGDYQITYFMQQQRYPLVSVPITVTEVTATITAPATAVAGATIEVAWTGPDERNDYIGIGIPDRDGNPTWENFTYTRDGATLRLQVPPLPGNYLITYFMQQDRRNLVSVPITVTPAQASLTLPATAVAGSTIEVAWTGPDYDSDYIGIGRLDRDGNPTWENFTYTRDGSPLRLLVPSEPGDYFVSYFLQQGRVVLASEPLSVTDATATLTAPDTAVAGSTIEVAWTGPDYRNDFIGIGRAGAEGADRWQNYTRTSEGTPLRLVTPPTPGTYVIRYFVDQDRVVLAESQITLTAPVATLTVPASAAAGSTVEVGWTGPDFRNDFIGIGRAGAEGSDRWQNYVRTQDGSPVRLLMPPEPGDYVIRYFIDQDRVTIAEAAITLTEVAATLTAPATAPAGGTVQVEWTGPNYPRDFIALGRAGAAGGERWQSYTATSNGSPLTLNVPDEPGAYMLRYFIDQDRVVIAELPITVQ